MKIGEIAKRAGVSRDTIRLYESRGMIVGVSRPNEYNNYKDYPEENLQRLNMILNMKKFGFSLGEIKEAVDAFYSANEPADFHSEFLTKKINALDEKINELVKVRDQLIEFLNQGCSNDEEMNQVQLVENK